ncbi:GNAT family N-acetyltransferase [Brachybacterium rhamnosum]|uniref:GNAT family N-acetyltransferase n=1 Tax=Brachybacterium rhamnosum TaxID=173361 RepID=A0ABW4Q045_9MICO
MATVDPGPTTIRPLSVESWELFDALVERHGGIFGGCWCTYFHPDDGERAPGAEGNREFKRRLVEEGVARAALVIREDAGGEEAVAWAEYGTPGQLPGLHHRQQYLTDLENAGESEPDYRVTCIFVDRRFRRHGLVTRALDGALALIAQDGGGVVEGYPHVPREKKVSASFLYNGTQSVYERAGFDFVRPKGKFNTVMRRVVAPA